jgi:tetrahydromethanopterin S-methyltransferase subunit C
MKKYLLKGAIIGALVNVLYTLITLLMFPIGDCSKNDLCGLMWELLNFHNLIIPIPFLKYNPPSSTLVASLIIGLIVGAIIGLIYGKVKNRRRSMTTN